MTRFPPLIRSRADVDAHLAALLARDSRLVPIADRCGEVPLRILGAGYAGLVKIIVGQLLSVAAASAIHQRLEARLGVVTPEAMLAASEQDLRDLGLSRAKIKSLKSIATALDAGHFDLGGLGVFDGDEALRLLMDLPGVGRWTAEIYLISALGHPDCFPAGDLALRKVVRLVAAADDLPSEKEVRLIAEAWSPHRAVAARLLWRYFAVLRDKEGISL
ncbi:MAG: DNA-3-methyladenine glycosylase 2 family protein [Hyphomicrobiaceae bacterium]|nr:DNA-3-methyladenine glycosylase 2 family protein [Hyphomicrobiaceae bacterium]MCC0023705.1 DNA-3-methyladenine glycosylase 2 family protein [Hyphomicrobiaceae bacterium]